MAENKIPSKNELTKELKEKEKELKAEQEKAAKEKEDKEKAEREKKELEKALATAKKELEDSLLRNEIQIEEEIKRRTELAKKKENVDIYIKITAFDDFNWPNIFALKKGENITLNQTRFDFLVNKIGNFKQALEQGRLRIG